MSISEHKRVRLFIKVIPFFICLSILSVPFSALAINTDLVYSGEVSWIDEGVGINYNNHDYFEGFSKYIIDENEGCFYLLLSFTDLRIEKTSNENITLGFTVKNDVNAYNFHIDKTGMLSSSSKNSFDSIDVYYDFDASCRKQGGVICVAFKLKNSIDRELNNEISCEYYCGYSWNYLLFENLNLDMYVPTTAAATTQKTTKESTQKDTSNKQSTTQKTTKNNSTQNKTTEKEATSKTTKESTTKFSGTGSRLTTTSRNGSINNSDSNTGSNTFTTSYSTSKNATTKFSNTKTTSYTSSKNNSTKFSAVQELSDSQEQDNIADNSESAIDNVTVESQIVYQSETNETQKLGMSFQAKLLLIIFATLFVIGAICILIGLAKGKKNEVE